MTRIGVVGGVGPLAAAYFYERLLRLSGATKDEDYPAVVLAAEQVPSRVDHLLHGGPNPLPALLRAIQQLERAEVDMIAIPSVTTHAYRAALTAATAIPVLDLLAETGTTLVRSGLHRPLILGTSATTTLRLLEPYFPAAIDPHYPDAEAQQTINNFIDLVKRGQPTNPLRAQLTTWINCALRIDQTLDCVVLGCTELSVIAPKPQRELPLVDVTEVLAKAVLATVATPGCGRPFRELAGLGE